MSVDGPTPRPRQQQPPNRADEPEPEPAPPPTALRRALARARDGKALDQGEAAVLLHARGDQLTELLGYASRARDAGLEAAGRPGVITYSRKVFIPLTRLCRDRCGYCTFVTVPGRLDSPYLSPDEVIEIAAGGSGARLQGGAIHARRPAGGPVAAGQAVAGRARLRRHAVLRQGDGDPGARGDRPAAASQPGRADLAGLPAAEAGSAVHGHDAGDDGAPAVHRAGRPALRQPGQGPRGQAAGARGRRPQQRPVHHRHPDRHRRDHGRARRLDLRDPRGGPGVPRHPGSHRAELPGQARHQDARRARRRPRGPGRDDRGGQAGAGPGGADPGPAEPDRRRSTG